MKVIKADTNYYDDIIQLIREFNQESFYEYNNLPMDESYLIGSFIKFKDSSFCLIDDNDKCVGILAGQAIDNVINGTKWWQEIVWYVNKDYRLHGVRFLRKAEQMLKDDDFQMMIMVCLHNSKTDKLFRLYERTGFKAMETHFLKQLQGANNNA